MRKVYLLEIIFVIWLIILVLLLVPFAVKAEDGEPPMIAFTFDDGPKAVQTSRLLTVCRSAAAKATFFVDRREA